VTRKASLRPPPQRVDRFRRRSKPLRQIAYAVVSSGIWTIDPPLRARGVVHPRATKAGAKKCRPHKNDAIASNTIDVRRRNFRCAHRTRADRTIGRCGDSLRTALCDSRRRVSAIPLIMRWCAARPRRKLPSDRVKVVMDRGGELPKSIGPGGRRRQDWIGPNKGCRQATIVAW